MSASGFRISTSFARATAPSARLSKDFPENWGWPTAFVGSGGSKILARSIRPLMSCSLTPMLTRWRGHLRKPLRHGVPVVASVLLGGLKELFDQIQPGYMLEHHDEAALADLVFPCSPVPICAWPWANGLDRNWAGSATTIPSPKNTNGA